MLSDDKMKEMYMARSGCGESYATSSAGRKRFDATARFIMQQLVNEGWTPSSKVEHREEGEVILYRLGGDSIILKDKGIKIVFSDGDWKWFSMGSFMNHLKLYRKLVTKARRFVGFMDKHEDEF